MTAETGVVDVADEFQVDTKALRDFRDAILNTITGTGTASGASGLANDPSMKDNKAAVDPAAVAFGQDLRIFGEGAALRDRYTTGHSGFMGNYQRFLDALEALANAAGTIAQAYDDASDTDVLAAKAIDDAINSPLPTTSTTTKTQ